MTSEKYSLELFPILSLFLADSVNGEPAASSSQVPRRHELNRQSEIDENDWMGTESGESEEPGNG